MVRRVRIDPRAYADEAAAANRCRRRWRFQARPRPVGEGFRCGPFIGGAGRDRTGIGRISVTRGEQLPQGRGGSVRGDELHGLCSGRDAVHRVPLLTHPTRDDVEEPHRIFNHQYTQS
jgi:hypothetical protein